MRHTSGTLPFYLLGDFLLKGTCKNVNSDNKANNLVEGTFFFVVNTFFQNTSKIFESDGKDCEFRQIEYRNVT